MSTRAPQTEPDGLLKKKDKFEKSGGGTGRGGSGYNQNTLYVYKELSTN